jgi:hypothetical protein
MITISIPRVTVTLGLALVMQLVGTLLLRRRLGRPWLRRPVTLLYLFAIVNQGISAVLLSFPSTAAQDPYRLGVAPGYQGDAALLTSAAMLALVIAYLLTQPQWADTGSCEQAVTMPDWRLLAVACAPLAYLTYEGKGYNNGTSLTASTPLATDLAASFFTIMVIVTAFAFLLRHGPAWFLAVLTAQSLALAAAGERTPVIAGAVALGLMLGRAGMRPPARQVQATVALVLLLVLAITGARVIRGRGTYETATGLGTRAQALGAGITTVPSLQALTAEGASRMDGEAFTAAILQARAMGTPRMSTAYAPESLAEVVPSFLWPSKLAEGNALNPALTEINGFGLQYINFLPTLPGLYVGFLPWPWLIALMAAIGAVCGWGEKWLLRRYTPARLVLLAGAILAVAEYQAGLPAMVLALRSAAVIAVPVWALERARGRFRVPHWQQGPASPTIRVTSAKTPPRPQKPSPGEPSPRPSW